jgi:hypothetical protein
MLSAAADTRSARPRLPPALQVAADAAVAVAAAAAPAPALASAASVSEEDAEDAAAGAAASAAAAAADALAAALRTSPQRGLAGDAGGAAADRAARVAAFGANRLPGAATSSLWQLLAEAASDTTMIMLMVAGALSIGLSVATHAEAADYIDGGGQEV